MLLLYLFPAFRGIITLVRLKGGPLGLSTKEVYAVCRWSLSRFSSFCCFPASSSGILPAAARRNATCSATNPWSIPLITRAMPILTIFAKCGKSTLDFIGPIRYTIRVFFFPMPVWWNWQTPGIQNPVSARTCGFDPRHRHQIQT